MKVYQRKGKSPAHVNRNFNIEKLQVYAQTRMVNENHIFLDLPQHVFGDSMMLYLSQEDILEFVDFKEIGAEVIAAYMWYVIV